MISGILSQITPKGRVSVKISTEDKRVEPNVPDLKELHLVMGVSKNYEQFKCPWLTL